MTTGILQPDGKLLISGGFTTVNGVARPSFARLNSDGTLDPAFVPASGGSVIARQQDGKILVAAPHSQPGVVRLNSDGSLDSTFQSDLTKDVTSLLIQNDGKVIVSEDVFFGEQFTTLRLNSDGSTDPSFTQQPAFAIGLDSNNRVFLATSSAGFQRLNADGTIDSTFQPDAGYVGYVQEVAEQPDGKLIVAGSSYLIEPFGIRRLLADGRADPTFNVGMGLTNIVGGSIDYAQLLPEGGIIVSGSFTHIDTLPRSYIARLNHDGTPDPDFDAGNLLTGPSRLLTQPDGKILVSNVADGLVRLEATGEIDATFQFSGAALPLAVQRDGKLLVATATHRFMAWPASVLLA